jgi:hypothetical protein
MMAERGVALTHITILRWVQRYVPEFEKRWNKYSRPVGGVVMRPNCCSMSVVAVSLPEFQLWSISLVAVIESRNIAAIMDGSGFSPPAASSVAFNTMKAAAAGTKCDTTEMRYHNGHEVLECLCIRRYPTGRDASGIIRNMNALRPNPMKDLRQSKQDHGPHDPLPCPLVQVEVHSTFRPQAQTSLNQRQRRCRRRNRVEQCKKVRKELGHRHDVFLLVGCVS